MSLPGLNINGKPQTSTARAQAQREGRLKAAIRRLQMKAEEKKERKAMLYCGRCGAVFYDDGNTLCPRCDSVTTAAMPGVLPDAGARILAMRIASQEKVKRDR